MLNLKIPWEEVKEKIKETNIELTDEDLRYQPGSEKKLLEHLAKKMSMSEEEIKDWIESVASNSGKAS
ncbi:MAG: general stress protein CsbD [Bacteroidota bacterium]